LAAITSAFAAAALLLGLGGTTVLGATTLAAACDAVNLRSGASTSDAIKASVQTGTTISVVATVTGGSWSSVCAGKAVAGSSWYRISAVNGKAVTSLYGVTYVYGATGLFKAVTVPPPSPTPTPTPSPGSGPTKLGATVTFFGRGYGHGVGMSQSGAEGRATAGQTAATILAHYYKGTTLGTTPNAQIRVLVLSSWAATATSPLRLYGRGGTWTFDGIAKVFPADAQARLTPTVSGTVTTWTLAVDAVDGTNLYEAATSGNLRMRPSTSATTLQLFSKPTTYDRYRGVLRTMVAAGGKVSVVNEVPLETYLKAVVPAEMSPSAPTEALKAQAIASRSYAVYRLHPTTGSYDIYDDTRSQVYLGALGEKTASTAVVTVTSGQVLRYGTAIVDAFYHSTGGGATESNQNVWVSPSGVITSSAVPYLQGSPDRAPDGSSYDAGSTYATWHTATYTLAQVQAFFGADTRTNVGTVVALDLSRRGVARLISVTLVGANGTTKTVSADVFDAVFNAHRPPADPPIRSTLFALAPIP
jgi:SpoIID/LytB domain protein